MKNKTVCVPQAGTGSCKKIIETKAEKQATTTLTYKNTDLLKIHTHKTRRVRKQQNVCMYKKISK